MNPHLERGRLLLQQSRYDLAEAELRQGLVIDPEQPTGHTLLSTCLRVTGRKDEALAEAQTAVHLAPDWDVAHYVLAKAFDELDRLDDAELAIAEAIRLDPHSADYHALRASLRYQRSDWAQALDCADEGLRCDPANGSCLNLRAMALTQLGRRDEAAATTEGALANDPQDATSHAVAGWNFLHKGDPTRALTHFREALRIDPQFEYARLGMIEALKARHLIYRVMLAWFLWMGRLTHKAQWAVIIGLVVASVVLRRLRALNPALGWVITPLLIGYFAFFMMSWIAKPLFNLLLRFNRFGRQALSPEELTATNWMAGFALAGLAGLAGLLVVIVLGIALLPNVPEAVVAGGWAALYLAAWGFMMLMPVAGTFDAEPSRRRGLALYTAALAVIGLACIVGLYLPGNWQVSLTQVFMLGWVLFSWIANARVLRL